MKNPIAKFTIHYFFFLVLSLVIISCLNEDKSINLDKEPDLKTSVSQFNAEADSILALLIGRESSYQNVTEVIAYSVYHSPDSSNRDFYCELVMDSVLSVQYLINYYSLSANIGLAGVATNAVEYKCEPDSGCEANCRQRAVESTSFKCGCGQDFTSDACSWFSYSFTWNPNYHQIGDSIMQTITLPTFTPPNTLIIH